MYVLPAMTLNKNNRGLLKLRKALFIFLSLLTVIAVAAPEKSAREWLKSMSVAVKTLNYEGVFIYIHGKHLESMKIIHQADERGERERLLSLNGSAREIIRDNDRLTCILPDNKAVVVEKSRPRKYISEALLRIDHKLEKHYKLAVVGNDRVAGKAVKVIAIIPRDKFRYGHRLWLDKKTGMLLRSDVVNEKGVAVEQFMFTHIKFMKKVSDASLKPATSGVGYKWYRPSKKDQNADRKKERQWKVTGMPAGFKQSMYAEHGLPTSRMPVDHFVLSDGLSSVSVYVEKIGDKRKLLRGTSSMGAVNAFGLIVKGYQITVVGEVPKATVMLIGHSVRRIKK